MPLRTTSWSCIAHDHQSGEVREPRIMVAASSAGVTYTIKPSPDAAPIILRGDDYPDTLSFVRAFAAAVFDEARQDQPARDH